MLADAAFFSATGANHVEGAPVFVSGAQIESLFGALNNFMTSLGYSGLSRSMAQFGSGTAGYSDYSGSLVGSLGRMLATNTPWSWSNSPSVGDPFPVQPPDSPVIIASGPTPPSLAIGLQYGNFYFANNQKVLESDSFGIQCQLQLSVPTSGQPLILHIGGNAVANTHYKQTVSAGDVITDWEIYPSADSAFSPFSLPQPIDGAYITWLGNGNIAIHLPPGVTSFYFKVPLMDANAAQNHTFEYTLLDAGGYTLSTSATGKVTIVPDSIAQEEGWVPPKPGDPNYNDFIADDTTIPGPKGPIVALTPGSDSVLENADQSYSLTLTPRGGGGLSLTGGPTTIVLDITGKGGTRLDSGNFDGDALANTIATTYGVTASYDTTTGKLTITLPNGWSGSSITFSAGLTPDSTVETGTASEQINIKVAEVTGNEASHNPTDVKTDIIDIPTVSVEAGAASFSEDGGTVTFTFSLSSGIPASAMAGGLPVTLNWAGTALGGCTLADGTPLPTSITFAPGQTTFTLTVKGTNDHLQTGNKALNVTITPDGGTAENTDNYHVADSTSGKNTATAERVDDAPAGYDGPLVRLVAGTGDVSSNGNDRQAVVNEDGTAGNTNGAITFKVELVDRANTTLAYSAQEEITVTLTLSPKGTATYGADYELNMAAILAIDSAATFDQTTGELIIHLPAGTTSFSLPVIIKSDAIKEAGEGFTLTIDSVNGNESTIFADKDTVETDIADGETLVSLTTNATPVNEGSNVTGTITLDKAFAEPVTITLKLNDGNGNITTHTVTVAAGSTTANYSLPTTNTDKQEGNRTYTVSVDKVETASGDPTEAVADPTNGTATGTIQDVMDGPVLSLSTSAASTVTEDVGTVAYTVTLSEATVEPVDVVLTLSSTGANGATIGTDVKWPDTQAILDALHAQHPGHTFTITANENGVLQIRVPAGFPAGSFTVPATIVNDTFTENSEQYKVDLSITTSAGAPGSEATVNTTNDSVTVGITDDNNGPQISVSAGTSVSESAGTTPITVAVNGTPTEPIDLVLQLSSSGSNGAVIGTDVQWPDSYAILAQLQEQYPGQSFSISGRNDSTGNVTIRVPAGFDQGSLTINALIADNSLTESADKQFTVDASISTSGDAPGSEASILPGGNSTDPITITDDTTHPDGPTVQLVLCDANGNPLSNTANAIAENGGTAHYKLQLMNADGSPYTGAREAISVSLNVTGGTGLKLVDPANDISFANGTGGTGWDYNASTGKITVTIPAGQPYVTFTGTAKSDTTVETTANETVSVAIDTVQGNESSKDTTKNSTTTTIEDAPTVSVAAGKLYYSEGASPSMDFTFTLTSPALEDTVIYFTCAPGAGLGLTDFTGLTGWPTSVTILKGQTTATLNLPINNDALSENNEALTITLNAQGNVNGNYHVDNSHKTATSTIVDDTKPWDPNYGPKPDGHGEGQAGAPIVRLTPGAGNLNTGAEFDGDSKHAVVNEDDINEQGSTIYYKLDLVDASGDPHVGAVEAITVEIDVEFIGGSTYGAGGDFTFDLVALQALTGVTSATYNTTTHKLTLVLAAGTTSVNIPVKIAPDQLTEKGRQDYDDLGNPIGNPTTDEAFTLKIGSVTGGEARIDTDKDEVNTTIDEATQGIQVSLFQISGFENGTEGDANPATDGFVTIGLQLSKASDEPVVVLLKQTQGDGSFTTLRFVIEPSHGANLVEFKVPIANNQRGGGNGTGIDNYTLELEKVIGGEASIDTTRTSVSGTITDNMDGPKISITANEPDVHESDPNTTAPDGTTSAEFTVKVDGVPTEPIDITLNINLTDDAKWLSDADLTTLLAGQGCEFISRTGGQLTVRVPAGFGSDGNDTFKVKLNIVDDNLTEGSETLTVSLGIVRSADAPGSEATLVTTGGKDKASTTITDDSKADGNLDGAFLHLQGTRFISESGGHAQYQVVLRDANGDPVTATETITMRLTYEQLVEAGYDPAEENVDYERLDSQYIITIPAGSSVSNLISIRIADDRLSENNEGFEVAIDPATVTGGEARIADPDDIKVKTIIVDDTKAWPDTTGQVPNDGFAHNEVGNATHNASQLDGPKVSITGSTWVAEPVYGTTDATLDFTLNLDTAPEEDVTVTLKLEALGTSDAGKGFDLNDLFGTDDINAINTLLQNKGSSASNFRVNPDGTGWLFDVTVPKNTSGKPFSLPLQHDDITEANCKFKTSIDSVKGAEARIGSANSSITTEVTDESPSSGPSITLKVLDYDGTTSAPIANETGQWEQNASLPNDYTPGDKATGFVYFQVGSNRPVAEETTVTFKLYNLDGSVITTDKGITGGTWNAATHSYTVKIPKDASVAEFSFAKKAGADYYRVQLTDTDNSESVLGDSGQCVSEVQQYTTGGTTEKPAVSVTKVDGAAVDDTATGTKEGENATFNLHINKTTTEAITVTMKLSGISAGFDLDDIGSALSATGATIAWKDEEAGTFTITIPSGYGPGDIPFTLPIVTDAVYEGKEGYMLSIINTGGGAWIGGTSAKAEIIDSIPMPILSLEDANETAGVAVEGGNAVYRLVLDKQPFGNITVTLKYTGDSGTVEGQDYSPVKHVNIPASDWHEEGGKWYYEVKVPLPDDQVEGDKGFTVEIDSVTGDVTVDGAHKTVDTDITDNLNGPILNFAQTTATIDEDGNNGTAKFELTLTRPAAQDVTVKLKVTGTATEKEDGTDYDYDLSKLPSGYGIIRDNTGTYITFTIPKDQLKAVLDLNGIFNNDKLTEPVEDIKLEIVEVKGGEVQIGTKDATVTIKDTIDGGEIKVEVDTPNVNEKDLGTSTGEFTFTFTLQDGAAQQDVDIWFTFQGVTDNIPLGPHKITIEKGETSFTYKVPYSALNNDHKDEQPNTQFKLVITDIHGNETQGKGTGVAVTVEDDDHKPIAVDDAIVVLVPPAPGTHSWRIDVLANDSPEDVGDLLRSLQGSAAGKYGSFSIDNEGYLTYTLDGSNDSVKKLTTNQGLTEDAFAFTISDTNEISINGQIWNPVASKATLEIKTTNKYTGTTKDQWIMGSDQAEEIDGGGGVDKIHAGAGNDTLHVHAGGKGFYYGEDGDDLFVVPAANLIPDNWGTIDGGEGTDAVALANTDSGKTLDFTGWTKANITSIEVIDITGAGNNTLKLDAASLDALNEQAGLGAPIRINGNSGDMLALADFPAAWSNYGSMVDDYYTLEHSSGSLILVHKDLALVVESDNADIDVTNMPGTGNFVITGGDSDNTITAGVGGKDIVNAGAGDDVIILKDTGTAPDGTFTKDDITLVDGGTGNDTLRIAGNGVTLDLVSLQDSINNVETFDISGSGAGTNNVLLNEAAFGKLASGNELYITGTTGDTYTLSGTTAGTQGGWAFAGTESSNGTTWNKYTLGSKTLFVNADLSRIVEGGTGADTLTNNVVNDVLHGNDGTDKFALKDLTGDNTVSKADFGTIDGGVGADTLTLSQNDQNLNLSNLDANTIKNVEAIDVNGVGSNRLTLDANTLTNMGIAAGQKLTVTGDVNDSFELTGNWTYKGLSTTYRIYEDATGAQVHVHTNLARVINAEATGSTLANTVAKDQLMGGVGNDTFAITDLTADAKVTAADFGKIAGGGGNDVLTLGSDSLSLDLSGVTDGQITGITAIHLNGFGSNTLVIGQNTLAHMGLGSGTLTVEGNNGDTFVLQGTGWTFAGLDGNYATYSQGTATVKVHKDLSQSYIGDAGANTFVLVDKDGGNILNGDDFASITGGGATDTLKLAQNDVTLDLTLLGEGKISGIEVIDLNGAGNNSLVLDDNTLGNMGLLPGEVLKVNGNAGDTFTLQGNWNYSGLNDTGYHIYSNAAGQFLYVQEGLTRTAQPPVVENMSAADTLIGGIGNDVFTLHDTDNSGAIDKGDFASINGWEGTNTLTIGTDGLNLDLTDLPAHTVVNIAGIDLSNHGANKLILNGASLEQGKTYTVTGDAEDSIVFMDKEDWTLHDDNGAVSYEHTNGTVIKITGDVVHQEPDALVAPSMLMEPEQTGNTSTPLTGENTSNVLELASFTLNGMDTITLHDGQKLHIDADSLNALHEKGGVAMISGDDTTEVVLESVSLFRTGNTVEVEGTQFEYCSFTAPNETEIQMLIQTTLLTGQAG